MKLFQFIFSLLFALGICYIIIYISGEDPNKIFSLLINSSFNSFYDFGMTITYSGPLILTGLSVALAYNSGLFNIGAEGQLTIGALMVASVGCLFKTVPPYFSIFLSVCAAIVGGGLWGALAGYLKARKGAHEVITTIMLNFIAAGIASFITMYVLRDTTVQSPQTLPISDQYVLLNLAIFQGAPVTYSFLLSLGCAFLVWFFLQKSTLGYEFRIVGQSEFAARYAGINVTKILIMNMFFSGALAGLVGIGEVLGRSYCFKLDFSPGYGFTGIAVAFLARGNPILIIFSGLLFGIIQKGTIDLEIYSQKLTSDIGLILQALIILAVCTDGIFEKFIRKMKVS